MIPLGINYVMSMKVSDSLDTRNIYLNNSLIPRRRYLGEEPHKIGLKHQVICNGTSTPKEGLEKTSKICRQKQSAHRISSR